jgi:hypothetical protein
MNALIEDTLRLSQELSRNVRTLEKLVNSFGSIMCGRRDIQITNQMEVRMDSIRDALSQTAAGRSVVVQVQDDIRQANIRREKAREESRKRRIEGFEIAKRVRTLKELVHYTFVEYPKSNGHRVRFDVYQASKETVRSIGAEGGDAYEQLTRTLQFAHTSKSAFNEAVQSITDNEHNFNEYDSSDAVVRHAA